MPGSNQLSLFDPPPTAKIDLTPAGAWELDSTKRALDDLFSLTFQYRAWENKPYNSWGNGSAMQVSPVGFAFDTVNDVLEHAKQSAEVSHNHPEGFKGAQRRHWPY